jgi:hypothetical protein
MILADAATTWLPGADGLMQLGLIAATGIATMLLLPKDKPKDGEPSKGWLGWLPKVSLGGSSTPLEAPTVGEAYELLTRLDKLSAERVDDYKAGIDNARKHLTWLKTEGSTVAAP